ncbi:MAG: oligosaccharide flippase family protein, partial [Saprospiraceae bacterium]|nr:oligosaccharide flippase family protein [Saprospiraceae bacterium]
MKGLIQQQFNAALNLLQRGHPRSVKIKQHILASFFIKGTSIIIGFLLVPITLHYVDKQQYGIWLTLSSVIAWFALFDVGLGHGLRNKLSEALAKNDLAEARSLVSSTYAIITAIAAGLLILFLIVNPFINWSVILNVPPGSIENLSLVALVTFSFFCTTFVLQLLHPVFLAHQSPSLVGLLNLIANFISLVIIIALTKLTTGSLLYLALAVGLSPVVVLSLASLFLYRTRYRSISPSTLHIDKRYFYQLSSLGFKFFLIGITGLIIFSTDNLIIVQLFGPNEVPAYQVAFKYFGLITSVFTIIGVPFWSAYTEAQVNDDLNWILKTNKNLQKLWLALLVVALVMLALSSWFYSIWVPEIDVA